jgi:hypothetical protein
MAQSDEEEEDYMNMTFEETPKQKQETALQRAARQRREGEARSQQKSKAERAADAEAAREAALATALPSTNKGFKMMAKFGFKQGDTLGKSSENARTEPIQVNLKEGRSGIGLESEKKRKFRKLAEESERATKRSREEMLDYREAQRQQIRENKWEKDLWNAQKIAEQLHAKATGEEITSDDVPLRKVKVLWRVLVRRRREKLRAQKDDIRLNDSLNSRLPTLRDPEEDTDDRIALGLDTAAFSTDDLDLEDSEFEKFEAQPVQDRLYHVTNHLRKKHHYCFWCGHQYPDAAMDGCPGETEEEHD